MTFTVYPVPDAVADGTVINMRVMRLPLSCYTKDDLERESELPISYQLDVLSWAAYRAQRTWDGDAGAPTSAAEHKAAFDEAVKKAIKETRSKTFANMGIRYGQNGYSWIR
jgi:hypothetical protein